MEKKEGRKEGIRREGWMEKKEGRKEGIRREGWMGKKEGRKEGKEGKGEKDGWNQRNERRIKKKIEERKE